jgi:hypothetical protein
MQLFTNKFVCITLMRQNPLLAGGWCSHITTPLPSALTALTQRLPGRDASIENWRQQLSTFRCAAREKWGG